MGSAGRGFGAGPPDSRACDFEFEFDSMPIQSPLASEERAAKKAPLTLQSTTGCKFLEMEEDAQPEPAAVGASRWGLLAALLATLCCVGPLIPVLLGLGVGAALFGLDQYRPWFLGAGLALLGLASWRAVRRQRRQCRRGQAPRPSAPVAAIFVTGIGFYLLLQYGVAPALAGLASEKLARQDRTAAAPAGAAATGEESLPAALLKIDGMDCAACAVGVEEALRSHPGAREARVDWRGGEGEVVYDPSLTTLEAILQTELPEQYALRLAEEPRGGAR